jgi:hypothetical protein
MIARRRNVDLGRTTLGIVFLSTITSITAYPQSLGFHSSTECTATNLALSLKRLPDPFEPNEAYENIRYQNKPLNFRDPMPGSPLLSQLMSRGNKLVLFRVIRQRYEINSHHTPGRPGYAYSLNPMVALSLSQGWDGAPLVQKPGFAPTVLIAINDLKADHLYCTWRFNEPLTPETRVTGDLGYEINAPYSNENVVATVPLEAFRQVISRLNPEFSLRTLLEELIPYMKRP